MKELDGEMQEPDMTELDPQYREVNIKPNDFTDSPEELIELLSSEYQYGGSYEIDEFGHLWILMVTNHGVRMVRRLYNEIWEHCNEFVSYEPTTTFISTISYEVVDELEHLHRPTYEVRIEVVSRCSMTGKVHFTMSMKADDLQPNYIDDHRKELDRRLNFLFSNAKFVLNQELDSDAVAQMSPRYKEIT